MKKRSLAMLLLSLLGLNSQATSDGWTTVNIKGTALETSSIQVLGQRGISARCNPEGLNLVPDFNSSSSLCSGASRINSGSRTKILEVYQKGGRYAAKVEVTHSSRPGESGSAQVGKVQWVEFDPGSPFLQIYDERTGAVHPLEKYLAAAAAGEKIEIPAFEQPEDVDAVVEARLENSGDGDDPGAAPTNAGVISGNDQIPDQDQFQSPLPGATTEVQGPIIEPVSKPLPANSNFCQMPVENERIDDKACLDQPSQQINDRWRNCPDRDPSDMGVQGDANYKNWLVDLVKNASTEVSQSPNQAGSSCASPAIMMSLMDQESTFNPMAGGNQWGDHGIAQFQKTTAEDTFEYLQRVAAADSPLRNVIKKTEGLLWMPPGCYKTAKPWQDRLTPECQRSIAENCVQDGRLVASLYCPQFAVRLQAFHIKQICSEEVDINGVNVTQVLQGNGDPVAQARFVVSRYNRGMRIYNSAAHYFAQYGKFPTAHEYGELWNVRRPTQYANRSSDPFQGGNLLGQTINRCYNWRIAGLCGGIKGTIFNHYLNITCATPSTPATPTSPVGATGVTHD